MTVKKFALRPRRLPPAATQQASPAPRRKQLMAGNASQRDVRHVLYFAFVSALSHPIDRTAAKTMCARQSLSYEQQRAVVAQIGIITASAS